MNWLKYLVAIAAIMIAGSAAYFSVTGLGILFAGASISVMIMAGSLEFAKLVTATYLKQKWDVVKGFNKWYLTSSVAVLMVITSAGIFGYLSNAFQQQNLKLDQVQRDISVWDTKIKTNNQQVSTLTNQLNNLQSNQDKIIDNGKVNNRLLKSIDNRDKQTNKISDKISLLQDENVKYNEEINKIKNNNIDIEREVGGFRFVAQAFNVDLNTVVKFFIILIVIVFDPLAIALVIALNQLVMNSKLPENKEEPKADKVDEPVDKIEAVDLVGEISRWRASEEDLKVLEKYLNNPPEPNEKLKESTNQYSESIKENNEGPTDEERAELLDFLTQQAQEMGLYDYTSNPLIKEEIVNQETLTHEPTIEDEQQNYQSTEQPIIESKEEPKVEETLTEEVEKKNQ
jgi:hypothetical protein